MASVSNVFDALQSNTTTSKKKRRNKKKSSGEETETAPLTPPQLPTPEELETQAAAAVTAEARLTLWDKWTSHLQDEEGLRRGPYLDQQGRPGFFRNVLFSSKALESMAEACVDGWVTEEQRPVLLRLFESAFGSIKPEVLQQLATAVVKVSSLARGKGPEVIFASKRALRDVISTVKRTEVHGGEPSQTWKKKQPTKPDRSTKKPYKIDKKAELHEALEAVKTFQGTVDEVDDETEAMGTGVHRSVSDLQVTLSLATRPMEDTTGSKKGRKGKKGPQTSPMVESLKQEEAAYAAEEARLNEEITSLEMKLRTLRSQLSSLHVTRQQVRQRKEAALQSLSNPLQSNGATLISPEAQSEAVESLEAVIAELQSTSGPSHEQKRELVGSYVESLEKFFGMCFSRQEDLMKTVKFLKDAIQRRHEQEIKMKEIASVAVAKDILKTQQHSKHELEQQLKDAMFDGGDLMIKVSRVEADLRHRSDFVRRYAPVDIHALENAILQIKETHNEIKRIVEERREVVVPQKNEREPEGWTRVNTKEIIKEEEIRVREELVKPMVKGKSPTASKRGSYDQGDTPSTAVEIPSQSSSITSPVIQAHSHLVYSTPTSEPIHPQHTQSMPVYGHPTHDYVPHQGPDALTPQPECEVHHPIPGGYYSVDTSKRPIQAPIEMEAHDPRPSGSKPRMAWKKIDEQSGSTKTDLPTPGEARRQGKL